MPELLHSLGKFLRFCSRALVRIFGLKQLISQCAPQCHLFFQLQLRFICAQGFRFTQLLLLLYFLFCGSQLSGRLP